MKEDRVYLTHILECISDIESYVETKEDFYQSKLIQDAVIRNMVIIGEATKNISTELRSREKDIPWREMAALRDVLIHKYFGLELKIIWNVVSKELP
ncbi:MAG TPA: DUF86 domain-containing protein [Bacillales bacterium]|nr:DUF86 domain-containing protein [Bacillales bacterium]